MLYNFVADGFYKKKLW